MKKEAIYKIGLTLVCASILAACGGSGGDDAPTVTPPPAVDPAPVDPAPVDPAPSVDADLGEGVDAYEYKEQDKVVDSGYIQGAQTYLKYNSNFEPGTPKAGVHRGLRQRMDLELHPSLDTIVLGWTKAKSADGTRAIYLEDFDFVGNTTYATIATATSTPTLHKLQYKNGTGLEDEPLHIWQDSTHLSTNLKTTTRAVSETKTAQSGNTKGLVAAYTHNMNNYTNTANYRDIKKHGGILQENQKLTYDGVLVPNHNRQDTVAEVYGHRTFVNNDAERTEVTLATATPRNLPLVNPQDRVGAPGLPHVYYDGEKLNHLQYGRVTSFLNKKKDGNALETGNTWETTGSFRVGKPLKNETRIASWGKFGIDTQLVGATSGLDTNQTTKGGANAPNTKEDTYFYRGIGATTKAEIANLAKSNVVAEYHGHAVTYGLDHNKQSSAGIPNAIGASIHFVSGTHAFAKVDFAKKELTNGQLFNKWSATTKSEPYNDVLVKFEGKLDGNAVYGTANKNYGDRDAGKFVGTFYGESAQELGGNIYSDETGVKAWGGVFGAITQEESSVGPGPNLD